MNRVRQGPERRPIYEADLSLFPVWDKCSVAIPAERVCSQFSLSKTGHCRLISKVLQLVQVRTELDHIRFRRAELSDCAAMAAMHCEALPSDLLPRLGAPLLANSLFPWMIASSSLKVMAMVDHEALVGFSVVQLVPGAFQAVLNRNRIQLLWPLLRATLREPRLAIEITCSTLFNRICLNEGCQFPREAHELSFMVVAASHRGRRLGERFMQMSLDDARADGLPLLIRTAIPDLERFYRRWGFVEIGRDMRCSRNLALMQM